MDSRQPVSFQNDFIRTCFPQKFLQSFLRALLQVIAVGSSDLPKAKQCAAHIFVILLFQLRKQLQPDLVPGIDALMIGMILHRTQIVLPAVLTILIDQVLRRTGKIKDGDYKLDL